MIQTEKRILNTQPSENMLVSSPPSERGRGFQEPVKRGLMKPLPSSTGKSVKTDYCFLPKVLKGIFTRWFLFMLKYWN